MTRLMAVDATVYCASVQNQDFVNVS